MDRVLRDKWVAALRSGEYIQARKCLRDGSRYSLRHCCISVFAEVADIYPEKNMPFNTIEPQKAYSALSETAQIDIYKLIHLNDGAHYDFNQIADWIEANL